MYSAIRTDVTAVKLYQNHIFAGIGSNLFLFEKHTKKLVIQLRALNSQKIYGFVPNAKKSKIIVFGGKQYTVITTTTFKEHEEAFRLDFVPVICSDWIHSAIWTDDDKIALLTAHNVVQIWDVSTQSLLSEHLNKENSILYSGLLLRLQDGVLVFAGTVFSEVIIHLCGQRSIYNLKGHRGVIFSISCCLNKQIIVTTSDDRSVRIWGLYSQENHRPDTKTFWENVIVTCNHEVYGHTARVMRSCITNDYIVSVGEDSVVCYWNFHGELLRKNMTHQNGSIWSVDADDTHLLTGGGDNGVILHPLTIVSEYCKNKTIFVDGIKRVIFTARRNIIMLNDKDEINYHDVKRNVTETLSKLSHESTYKLFSISSCKQIIAVADMRGNLDIFIENCKDNNLKSIIKTKFNIGNIFSMQWAGNRHLVLCSEHGNITVLVSNGTRMDIYANFVLPPCKERWLTSSAIDKINGFIIVGDRCGSIHIFTKENKDPFKSFRKVHGRYGPTSISTKNNGIKTTGRDGTIKNFVITNNNGIIEVQYMNKTEVDFQWVEKFLDKDDKIVCGFHERDFVVYDQSSNVKLLEVPCGGGHRSWDAIRYIDKIENNFDEVIQLVYIKNSDINLTTFQMSKIMSTSLINGSHAKEINCLKSYRPNLNDELFLISGGEDTTLRISRMDKEYFKDEAIFKHLSNIRTLKFIDLGVNKILVISAGGRAQICIYVVEFCKDNRKGVISQLIVDYLIKGSDKERKGDTNWRDLSIDFDPETRIMDIDVLKVENDFYVFAGCSDTYVRVFKLRLENTTIFRAVKDLKYHKTCILKTVIEEYFGKDILVTCSTRGEVSFWDLTDIHELKEPFYITNTNKSGVNSYSSLKITDKQVIIATGGDDNSVVLKLLDLTDQHDLNSLKISDTCILPKLHSSQITGVVLIDKYLISTSIDQRVTLCKWDVSNGVHCDFVYQTFSDIADIQGMDIVSVDGNEILVCVFGKGMEIIRIPKT